MPDSLPNRPLFIVFEGIDGSGKSTQSRLLKNRLEMDNIPFHATFEPTDQKIGKLIRSVIRKEENVQPETLAALFVADRLEHILEATHGMKAQLKAGRHVICDRYYFSSYAYHSTEVPMDWVIAANSLCAELLKPDIIFFIDVDPERCMQRIQLNRQGTDLFETQTQLEKIYANYHKAFEQLKDRENIVFVDGTQSESDIHKEIYQHLLRLK
jgi:dTMP kinase